MKAEILAVYDGGDEWADRYTIVMNWPEYGSGGEEVQYTALGLGDCPDHPCGFSQWVSATLGPHLGKQVAFEDLPERVRQHALERIARD